VDFLNNQLAEREGQVAALQQQARNTERMRVEAKQQLSASSSLQEANAKLTSQAVQLNEKIVALQESNSALKKNVEKARKVAAHARSDAGLRDSGGSLPGSASGGSRLSSPAHGARSPRSLNVQVPAPPAAAAASPRLSAPPNTPSGDSSSPTPLLVKELEAKVSKLTSNVTELRIALHSAEQEANQLNADNVR
jgi:hypothetical protein